MRASTAWLIAAAVMLSGISGCSSLGWPSRPKMPSLSSMNPFKKKKTAEQLADNGRPQLPGASEAARGSVPRVGGQAPAFQPPQVTYDQSSNQGYGYGYGANSGRGSSGYGVGGGAGSGSSRGDFAGPSGNGDFYRQDQTYRDDYPASGRGGEYAGYGRERGGSQYSRPGVPYDGPEQPIRTADSRNRQAWDGNPGVRTNGTQHPLAPTYGDDRNGSTLRETPRSNDFGGSTLSSRASRWADESYDGGSRPQQFEATVDGRFNKGGTGYDVTPSSYDSSSSGGQNANRLVPYRQNASGKYTPGSTGVRAGDIRTSSSITPSYSAPSYSAPASSEYNRRSFGESGGGEANRIQPPTSARQWQDEPIRTQSFGASAGSSTRDYDSARTSAGSGWRN